MPIVTVEMWEGRTVEQKRGLVTAITEAMVRHAGAHPEGLHVILHEVARENWGRAGVLGVDRGKTSGSAADQLDEPGATKVLGLGHLLLETNDLGRAEEFYVGLLGFTVRKREQFRDGRPLTVTNEGLGLTNGRREGPGPIEHIAFHVAGVRTLCERARKAGIVVLRGPESTAYGVSVYLADPDGNQIELYGDDEGSNGR